MDDIQAKVQRAREIDRLKRLYNEKINAERESPETELQLSIGGLVLMAVLLLSDVIEPFMAGIVFTICCIGIIRGIDGKRINRGLRDAQQHILKQIHELEKE